MGKQLTFLLFLLFTVSSFSQNFKITGTFIDKESRQPLEAATVFMETVKDSTLITYTITDKNGRFQLEGKSAETNVRINISFVGFNSIEKIVDLTKPVQDLGNLETSVDVDVLGEVIVKSRAPIVIKKDTLEFNVASFKTKKDANIEDLLKELPGVEVSADGKIKVNGKDVSHILVNGKPFFGDDPTIATRNLTKEIVEKVQVVDTKTKAEAFTGEAGDQQSKTINLTIKEENNKGVFGRLAAGGGTDKRFEYAGIFNYFNNDQRLSVLGGGNNINSSGFSFGEIRKMFGGNYNMSMSSSGAFTINGMSFGDGEGIINSRILGASYADVIKEKTDVSAEYFYSGSNSNSDSKVQRENILPDRRYFTNSSSTSTMESDSHRANVGFDIKVDSTFLVNIKPSFNFSKLQGNVSQNSASSNENDELTNSSELSSHNESEARKFENKIDITKRFGNGGGFFKASLNNEFNNTQSEYYLMSQTSVYGENPTMENRDQFSGSEKKYNNYDSRITYRQPLVSKKLFLDLKYSYRYNQTLNTESTFDFNNDTQEYSIFNETLSSDFTFNDVRSTPMASLVFNSEKITVEVGAGHVFKSLKGTDALRPEINVDQNFEALEMYGRMNIKLSPKAAIYTGYTLKNVSPEIQQLMPNSDVSDPLNTVTGNPALKPTDNHSFYFNFNNYDYQEGTGIYSYLGAEFNEDAIVAKTITDENNIRNTTFANVDGNYSLRGSVGVSNKITLDTVRNIRAGFGVYGNYSRHVNFNNGLQYKDNNGSIVPYIDLTFSWQDFLEIGSRYSLSYSKNSFDDHIFEDRQFLSHNVNFSTTFNAVKNLEWRNDINFDYNPGITPGFQKSAWFWNSTLAYSVLKKQGALTLKMYDLLNQNTNARRNSSENYIQDIQSTVLQQYFMLSFSWKFNTLGEKGNVADGF